MKGFLTSVFLGMALICHAQNNPKNEFSIGQGAGFFFDSTKWRMNSDWFAPNKQPLLTFTYTRLLNTKVSISATYAGYNFVYIKVDNNLKNNTVLRRTIDRFNVSFGYRYPFRPFQLRINAGLNYVRGDKAEHYFYWYNGTWNESIAGGILYNKLGFSLGANIRHPIVWHFFGEFSGHYQRVLSSGDKNQMYLTYSLGFEF